MRAWFTAVATVVYLLAALSAFAQTPVVVGSTSGISFTASVDHGATVGTAPNIVAVLAGYRLETNVFTTQLGALQFTRDLGKPTPGAGNLITVSPIAQFGTLPSGSYTAVVVSYGPGGEGRSAAADPFVRVGPPAAPGKPIPVMPSP